MRGEGRVAALSGKRGLMTCQYNVYFVLIWTSNILSLPGTLALFVWALSSLDVPTRAITGASLGVVVLTWAIYLRLHGPRVLMRAGAWPAYCTGDYFPRTESELLDAVGKITDGGKNPPPAVVGSGWAHFLYRRGPRGPRIFLHNFKGKQPLRPGQPSRTNDSDQVECWRSGTTIAQVNEHLRARKGLFRAGNGLAILADLGLTFKTHPTMDYISIGSWFSCGNHGNGGATAGKSSDALKVARVLDMKAYRLGDPPENYIFEWDYATLRRKFDEEFERVAYNAATTDPIRYCILDCTFHKLAVNKVIQKRCIVVRDEASAGEWLIPTAHLRLLFLGAARDVGLGIQWLEIYDKTTTHRDPHFCSRWCQFFQIDVFSTIFGWYESAYKEVGGVRYLTAWNAKMEWYHANLWMPTVWPWQTVTVVLAGYRNFEIFFYLPTGKLLDGKSLWRMVNGLINVHKKYGGRSELRHGAPDGAICLDVSMNREFIRVFDFLWDEFRVDEVAFHLGKFNDPREIRVNANQRRVMLSKLGKALYVA